MSNKAVALLLLLALNTLGAHQAMATKVLILNSYHPQFAWTAENTRGIRETLAPRVEDENIHIEHMDTRRFIEDDKYLNKLIDLYRYKYQAFKPDLIISTDDFALDFLVEHRDEIFGDIPVVFNGVNFDPTAKLTGKNNFTGIREGDSVKQNLSLIKNIHGSALKEILVLGDQSQLSQQLIKQARDYKAAQQQDSPIIKIIDNFSLEKFLFDTHNFAENSAIFITAIHKDSLGRYFSYKADTPDLTRYSPVPVYGMWGIPLMGAGVVGGYMNDGYLHGKNTAKLAIKILSGTSANDIPIVERATYIAKFDARALERFSIEESALPEDRKIFFQKRNFLRENLSYILIAFSLLLVLMAIITYLSVQVRSREKAELELAQLNKDLEKKVEERTATLENANECLLDLTNKMEALANTDDLTMIPNRRHGKRVLDRLEYDAERNNFTIALIDIDHFKSINDQHGHDIGDQVLQKLCKAVSDLIRPGDTLCRWGGEEFLLALPQTSLEDAYHVVERIRKTIFITNFAPLERLTISIGIASRSQAKSLDQLIKLADQALYQAKESGRNRSESHSPDGLKGSEIS